MKHYLILLGILFCIPRFATAQLPQSVPPDTVGYLSGMIMNSDSSYWKIDELATIYFGTTNDSVSPHFLKRYARWDYFWRSRVDSTGDRNKINEIVLDLAKNGPICSDNAQWVQKGPVIPGIQRSGIVTAVYSPPGQTNNPPDLIYVGSNTGGMWRTDNGGNLWENITDELRVPGLGIQDIVGDLSVGNNPQDPDLIYVATGKTGAFQNNSYGIGVLKYHRTTNSSGNLEWNWEETALSWSAAYGKVTSKIVLHPDPDPNIYSSTPVFCITENTFERSLDQLVSIDGSATLIPASSNGRFLLDLDILPAAGPNGEDLLFVAEGISSTSSGLNPRIWMSDDLGDTWTDISPTVLPATFGSKGFIMSTTEANPSALFAVAQDIGAQPTGFFTLRYDLSGSTANTWTIVFHDPNSNNDPIDSRNDAVLTGPLRPDYVINGFHDQVQYYAGNTLQRTTNGGSNMQSVSVYDPGPTHADIRDILLYESGNDPTGDADRIFIGDDGGVAFRNGAGPWQSLGNNSLILTQFFDIANTSQRADFYCGGTQDNGTMLELNGTWSGVAGGDGGQTIVDWNNPQRVFGRSNERILRSTDGGSTFFLMPIVSTDVTPYPFVQDQYDPDVIYGVGKIEINNIVRPRFFEIDASTNTFVINDDLSTVLPGGDRFDNINTMALGHKRETDGTITDIIYLSPKSAKPFSSSLPNHGTLWKGSKMDGDPNFTWSELPCLEAREKLINAIAIDKDNPDRIWLGFSAFTYRLTYSDDGGASYLIMPNLPVELPVNDLVHIETSKNSLFAATDVGVFRFV